MDPKLGRLANVFLHNMNDLDRVVARNIERRRQEIPRAEAIVQHETERFVKWYDSLQVTPTIKLLQQRFEMLRLAEIDRYGKLFSDGEELQRFTKGLCSKIQYPLIAFLRKSSEQVAAGDQLAAADMIRRIFELDALEDGG